MLQTADRGKCCIPPIVISPRMDVRVHEEKPWITLAESYGVVPTNIIKHPSSSVVIAAILKVLEGHAVELTVQSRRVALVCCHDGPQANCLTSVCVRMHPSVVVRERARWLRRQQVEREGVTIRVGHGTTVPRL